MADAFRIRWGMRNVSAAISAALLTIFTLVAVQLSATAFSHGPAAGGGAIGPSARMGLADLAADQPQQRVEVIVQLDRGTNVVYGRKLISDAGGTVTRDLHIINGFGARMSAATAYGISKRAGVRAVSLNYAVKKSSVDTSHLATAYPGSVYATRFWSGGGSLGTGVGVAVVDTGIQGDLPDFRTSQTDSHSRVIASAIVNPNATTAGDKFGHGTHVAGIIAGNGTDRAASDPLYGKYIGIAPEASLISVKASDDAGNASTLDVVQGLQFVVDHKRDLNIRVVNLSLNQDTPESYKTSALDAAAEAAWNAGIVVVTASGNRGTDADAVNYPPGNDPFVITVGAVDDQGTSNPNDDTNAPWSSRGTTQDGFAKPNFSAPGAHIVSTLAPKSAITGMCSSCVVDGKYFRMGGTSMATAVVSGAVAALLGDHPDWTPNQVKSAIGTNLRYVAGTGYELNLDSADNSGKSKLSKPNDYAPNNYIDSTTGQIDYSRSTWSRSTWSTASSSQSASWSRSTWSCSSCGTTSGSVSTSRSTWSRSTWSMSK